MDGLHQWCEQQFAERKVEPNSGLGKAIQYRLNHWQKLTLFLREPGAPLDNNICPRALKKAILHRENALFYRTINGARAGDLFMSLIHTAELCGANPFNYLPELPRHPRELAQTPSRWMPWNYWKNFAQAADIFGCACLPKAHQVEQEYPQEYPGERVESASAITYHKSRTVI
jgi:transposase